MFSEHGGSTEAVSPIRTLGTIGWIASGILVGSSFYFENEFRSVWLLFLVVACLQLTGLYLLTFTTFYDRCGVSILLGLYSFSLPNTPPKLKGKVTCRGAGLKALALMKDKSFAIFIVCSFLLCIPLSFYFQSANGFLKEMG